MELSKKLQETCERLQRENSRLQQENDALRGGRQLTCTPSHRMAPNTVFPRQPSPRPEQVVRLPLSLAAKQPSTESCLWTAQVQ